MAKSVGVVLPFRIDPIPPPRVGKPGSAIGVGSVGHEDPWIRYSAPGALFGVLFSRA